MQYCLNGVFINDVPKFLLKKNPTVNYHEFIIPLDIDDSSLLFPLMLKGVTNNFQVKAKTLSEYKSDIIPKFHLIAEAPMWDHNSSSYSLQEDSMLDFRGCIVNIVTATWGQLVMHVNVVSSSPFASYCVIDTTDDENFGTYLK